LYVPLIPVKLLYCSVELFSDVTVIFIYNISELFTCHWRYLISPCNQQYCLNLIFTYILVFRLCCPLWNLFFLIYLCLRYNFVLCYILEAPVLSVLQIITVTIKCR
jgi:hypothetical protein